MNRMERYSLILGLIVGPMYVAYVVLVVFFHG
jgi:hypothetical protein